MAEPGATPSSALQLASPATQPATTTQAEIVLWKSIESSSNPEDFQTYLAQYPHGAFAPLAQRHLSELMAPAKEAAQLAKQAMLQLRNGDMINALASANQAIATDPTEAMPYYVKGSVLLQKSTVDQKSGKIAVPAGCAEALQKYLDLAPDGPLAKNVESILASLKQ